MIDEKKCVSCGVCVRVCNFQCLTQVGQIAEDAVKCGSCPVQCEIKPGFQGACRRYMNVDGVPVRNRPLVIDPVYKPNRNPHIGTPLITGVGSGTTYPDCRPAPYIVMDTVEVFLYQI